MGPQKALASGLPPDPVLTNTSHHMPSPTVRLPDPPPPSPTHRRLVVTSIVIGAAVIAVGMLKTWRSRLRVLSGETEITALLREVPEDVKPYRPVYSLAPWTLVLSAGEALDLRRLLRTAQFDSVEIALRLAQDEAAVDVRAEWRYYDSYVALVEPSLRAALDAWIAAHPRVVEARIARGMYFVNLAGVRRGGAVAGRTKRAQFGALDATLDSSFAEIRVALKGDPSNLAAYWVLQRAAGFHGQADVLPTYNRALRLSPASFVTRWLAITNLAPRWGGTYESMDRVAAQAQQFASANPELRTLQGFVDWDKADAAWQRDDAERAISQAKASTSYGESYTLCLKAARILWYYDREPEALPFARCAVARRNASADGHLTLGRVLYGLGRRDPADWPVYYSRARESALLAYQLDSSDDQVSKFSREFSTAR